MVIQSIKDNCPLTQIKAEEVKDQPFLAMNPPENFVSKDDCILGESKVRLSILKDFGGNQVWVSISNEIFDSEDILPVGGEGESDFKTRFGEIVKKYQESIKSIQESKNQTQTEVKKEDIEKAIQDIYDKTVKCNESNEQFACNLGQKSTVAIFFAKGESWYIHFYQTEAQKINRTFYVPKFNGFSTIDIIKAQLGVKSSGGGGAKTEEERVLHLERRQIFKLK